MTGAGGIPIGVPPEAAAVAQATLGGAVAVAARLPGHLGVALLGTARDAFTQAFGLTVAISAVMALIMAPVAVILLRDRD